MLTKRPPANAIRDYQYLQDKKHLDKIEQLNRKLRLHKYFYSAADISDPWESHYSYFQDEHHHRSAAIDPLREILMHYLPSRLTFSHKERQARFKEYSEGLPPKNVSGFVDRLARFVVAIAGGVFIVPSRIPSFPLNRYGVHIGILIGELVIIMTLKPSETKSLITVSVAVVVFALILSFGIRVSNVETLVSTATYAAVLVVFVGTSGGTS